MKAAARIAPVLVAIALTALPTFAQSVPEPATTVFLVRHAERQAEGADPSLNDAGRARAKALADMLADAGITAIYTTEFHRTQETAAPLAEKLGIKVTAMPGKDLDGLIARVRELKPGGRALIVGHSNTVPAAASRLTGATTADMPDSEFNRLYVATFRGAGPGELVVLHYGANAN